MVREFNALLNGLSADSVFRRVAGPELSVVEDRAGVIAALHS